MNPMLAEVARVLDLARPKVVQPAPTVRVWEDGPLLSTAEKKAWDMDVVEYLQLLVALERSAQSTQSAVQRWRRLYYSKPLGGAGRGFDRFLHTDPAREAKPVTTADLRQSQLDALVRVGRILPPGGTPIDVSHVAVLLDLRLNGEGPDGTKFRRYAAGPNTQESILSWAGDLGSAWLAWNDLRNQWALHTTDASENPNDLTLPRQWLQTAIAQRSGLDDVLGDIDAVVLAHEPPPASATPITDLIATYYGGGGTGAHVADRFALFLTRNGGSTAIPYSTTDAGLQLAANAKAAIRAVIRDAAFWLLTIARGKGSMIATAEAARGVLGELDSSWSSAMLDDLAQYIVDLIGAGLTAKPLVWPSAPDPAVTYGGYPGSEPIVLDDLEALCQFHLNWVQPEVPLRTTDRILRPFSLRDPAGTSAAVVAGAPAGQTTFAFEPYTDLRAVTAAPSGEHRDLFVLDGGAPLRIVAVDPSAARLTAAAVIAPGQPRPWRILLRPRVVVVDPWGGRFTGPAAKATVESTASITLVEQASAVAAGLDQVTARFDTVRLPGDRARASQTYRIISVDPMRPILQLDAPPDLHDQTSAWNIPAGIVADTITPQFTFPPTAQGCDHYDAALLVIYADALEDPVMATSYTSTSQVGELASSIDGNTQYVLTSIVSGNDFRNFCFKVSDVPTGDSVSGAADFFTGATALRKPPPAIPVGDPADPPVPVDDNGKTAIRLHYGNQVSSNGTGSAGCVVSPTFFSLRAALIAIHQQERELLGEAADATLTTIANATTLATSKALYNGGTITPAQWNDRVASTLTLVRPNRRPIKPASTP